MYPRTLNFKIPGDMIEHAGAATGCFEGVHAGFIFGNLNVGSEMLLEFVEARGLVVTSIWSM